MFKQGDRRRSTFFEKILLIIGLGVILLGFHFINSVYISGMSEMWGLVSAVFLWLLLIICVVLLATAEDVKEELSVIMRQQVDTLKLIKEEITYLKEESTLMKEINHNQHEELKLIRREMEQVRYKR
ncbi:MAG: hypothetical protein KKG59_05990 [Nanoarchaeota archaeon]|nr:hypothetical protein [Nanoarchaeota archaeon]